MLNTDKYIFAVLRQNPDIATTMLNGRIWNTERTHAQQSADEVPYVIVKYGGGKTKQGSKDNRMEPLYSSRVSVLCVHDTRTALADMTDTIMRAVLIDANETNQAAEEHPDWVFRITHIDTLADEVEFDDDKPCYYQWIHFDIDAIYK